MVKKLRKRKARRKNKQHQIIIKKTQDSGPAFFFNKPYEGSIVGCSIVLCKTLPEGQSVKTRIG